MKKRGFLFGLFTCAIGCFIAFVHSASAGWQIDNREYVVNETNASVPTTVQGPVAYLATSLSTKLSGATEAFPSVLSAIKAANSKTTNIIVSVIPGNKGKNLDYYSISETITIESHVTLNIPYAEGSTNSISSPSTSTTDALSNESQFLQSCVTVEPGVTITNKGKIEIGGVFTCAGGGSFSSWTGGNYSELFLKEGAKLINQSTINCYGSINCPQSADFKPYVIHANGIVSLPMIWLFPGGTSLNATESAYESGSRYSPLREFFFRNIMCNLRICKGAGITTWVSLTASIVGAQSVSQVLINQNDSSGSLLSFQTGAYLDVVNTLSNGKVKHKLSFVGGGSLNGLNISVSSYSLNTANGFFPLTYLYDVSLLQSHEVSIKSSLTNNNGTKLLAGTINNEKVHYLQNISIATNEKLKFEYGGACLPYNYFVAFDFNNATNIYSSKFQAITTGTEKGYVKCTNATALDILIDSHLSVYLLQAGTLSSVVRDSAIAQFSSTEQDIKIMNGASMLVGEDCKLTAREIAVYDQKAVSDGWTGSTAGSSTSTGYPTYPVDEEGKLIINGELEIAKLGGSLDYSSTRKTSSGSVKILQANTATLKEVKGIKGSTFSSSVESWFAITLTARSKLFGVATVPSNLSIASYSFDSDHWDGPGAVFNIEYHNVCSAEGFSAANVTNPNPATTGGATIHLQSVTYNTDEFDFVACYFDQECKNQISLGTDVSIAGLTQSIIQNGHTLDIYIKWLSSSVKKVSFQVGSYTSPTSLTYSDAALSPVGETITLPELPFRPTQFNKTEGKVYTYAFQKWTYSIDGGDFQDLAGNSFTPQEEDADAIIRFKPEFLTTNTYSYPTVSVNNVSLGTGTGTGTATATVTNYNSAFTYEGTFSTSDSKTSIATPNPTMSSSHAFSTTITDSNGGNHNNSSTASTQITFSLKFYIGSQDSGYDTINSNFSFTYHTNKGSCIALGTLITLADGSQKKVEDLKANDVLLSFNHFTGKYEAQPLFMVVNHGYGEYEVIRLMFEDSSELKIVESHGLFDLSTKEYAHIDSGNCFSFIGHVFAKYENGITRSVKLVDVEVTREFNEMLAPFTYGNLNAITNGFVSYDTKLFGTYNYFSCDEDMKYTQESIQNNIALYGLYEYEYWEHLITKEIFDAFNFRYFKVAVGLGLCTENDIIGYIQWLSELLEEGSITVSKYLL